MDSLPGSPPQAAAAACLWRAQFAPLSAASQRAQAARRWPSILDALAAAVRCAQRRAGARACELAAGKQAAAAVESQHRTSMLIRPPNGARLFPRERGTRGRQRAEWGAQPPPPLQAKLVDNNNSASAPDARTHARTGRPLSALAQLTGRGCQLARPLWRRRHHHNCCQPAGQAGAAASRRRAITGLFSRSMGCVCWAAGWRRRRRSIVVSHARSLMAYASQSALPLQPASCVLASCKNKPDGSARINQLLACGGWPVRASVCASAALA